MSDFLDIDGAMGHFENAVARAPRHLESRYNLALIYTDRGRFDDAIEMLEGAALVAPNHELVNVRLGLAYLEANRGVRQGSAPGSQEWEARCSAPGSRGSGDGGGACGRPRGLVSVSVVAAHSGPPWWRPFLRPR